MVVPVVVVVVAPVCPKTFTSQVGVSNRRVDGVERKLDLVEWTSGFFHVPSPTPQPHLKPAHPLVQRPERHWRTVKDRYHLSHQSTRGILCTFSTCGSHVCTGILSEHSRERRSWRSDPLCLSRRLVKMEGGVSVIQEEPIVRTVVKETMVGYKGKGRTVSEEH